MLVGYSEISVSFIVKHLQYIGIIRVYCLSRELVEFFSAWGDRKHSVVFC